jgi:GntR family transcriptional repressor for pyruvate dehydrogenase complex
LVKPLSVHLLQSDKRIVAEFVEVRLILEAQGVKLAAARIGSENIKTLWSILDEEEQDINTGGFGQEADEKFHIQLMRFTHNTALCTMFEACQGILNKSINLTRQLPNQPLKALEGHRLIVKHLQEKNEEGVKEAMEAHLRQIYECMNQLERSLSAG